MRRLWKFLGPESAIESGDLALEAIRTGFVQSRNQMDAVESQAKSARNRLVNAVLVRHLVNGIRVTGIV